MVESKGRSIAESYFHILKPTVKCDDAFIKKYENLLAKIQKEKPDSTFLINMLKDTITDLRDKQKGILCSEEYLNKK
jgi:predicted RNase H-like nuclease